MERLRSCKYCGRIHPASYDCGKRPKRIYNRGVAEQGRYTGAWANKAKEIKERSNYLCAYCLMHGMITYDGLEVHHIVKLACRPDLLLDDSNLVCLCTRHHKQADRGKISAKELYELVKKRDGIPLGV